MKMLNDFMNNTKGLTRNPLGIIALFVSLIYGFACLVLSTSISNLVANNERLPLIWFIIIFPIIILIAFIYLVVNHHEKLYAPGDFRGDDAFIQTIDENKRRQRIQEEVENLEASPKSDETEQKEDSKENLTNESSQPEKIEVKTKTPNVPDSELIQMYTNSEKWSINELSLKYKVPLKAQVKLRTQNDNIELDGYGIDATSTYIVEVKFWQSSRSDKRLKLKIQEFLSKKSRLERAFNKPNKSMKIIIALVYDNLSEINQGALRSFVQELGGGNNVILEFFDYNELKKNFE
jgi:cytochrome c oxidase subunit IV